MVCLLFPHLSARHYIEPFPHPAYHFLPNIKAAEETPPQPLTVTYTSPLVKLNMFWFLIIIWSVWAVNWCSEEMLLSVTSISWVWKHLRPLPREARWRDFMIKSRSRFIIICVCERSPGKTISGDQSRPLKSSLPGVFICRKIAASPCLSQSGRLSASVSVSVTGCWLPLLLFSEPPLFPRCQIVTISNCNLSRPNISLSH